MTKKIAQNESDELGSSRAEVAKTNATAAAPSSAEANAEESCAQHGVRGGTGGREDASAGTRTPGTSTRFLNTSLGIISYAELAPHLAKRVLALHEAIAAAELDQRDINEDLILEIHRRICGDLTPEIGGTWRNVDVLVGAHEPPRFIMVPMLMRDYARDLAARLESLSPEPDELWLETLAFAEGKLLSIHPFADFNGRVTRGFIDLLTRRLNILDVDPILDPGDPSERYIRALRAADVDNWLPLVEIWKERLEQEDSGADE